MSGWFWKVCAVWALVLGSIAVARPGFESVPVQAAMPAVGQTVTLPPSLTTVSGEVIPAMAGSEETLFLVTSAGCAACRRELPSYADFLTVAGEMGFAPRMLVTPSSPTDTDWFLRHAPKSAYVVLDTLGVAVSGLGVGVTPSVVMVSPTGTVSDVFWPSRGWPVTPEMLDRR